MKLRSAAYFFALIIIFSAFSWSTPTPAFAQDVEASRFAEASKDASSVPPLIETKSFAGRSSFWNPEISPDGKLVSLFQRPDDTLQMTTFDLAKSEAVSVIKFGKGNNVRWTQWVDDDRMLMSVVAYRFALLSWLNPNMFKS